MVLPVSEGSMRRSPRQAHAPRHTYRLVLRATVREWLCPLAGRVSGPEGDPQALTRGQAESFRLNGVLVPAHMAQERVTELLSPHRSGQPRKQERKGAQWERRHAPSLAGCGHHPLHGRVRD